MKDPARQMESLERHVDEILFKAWWTGTTPGALHFPKKTSPDVLNDLARRYQGFGWRVRFKRDRAGVVFIQLRARVSDPGEENA